MHGGQGLHLGIFEEKRASKPVVGLPPEFLEFPSVSQYRGTAGLKLYSGKVVVKSLVGKTEVLDCPGGAGGHTVAAFKALLLINDNTGFGCGDGPGGTVVQAEMTAGIQATAVLADICGTGDDLIDPAGIDGGKELFQSCRGKDVTVCPVQ